MIVTVKQASQILAGSVVRAFVPPAHAARWHVGRPVTLRRIAIDENTGTRTRVVITAAPRPGAEREPLVITPVAFGEVQPLASVTLKQILRAGFRTTDDFRAVWAELYRSEAAVAEVVFVPGDWSDRPRLLAAGRRGADDRGYTTSPALALDDAECVDDAWLAKFARAANPFIEAKQAERRADQRRDTRSFIDAKRKQRQENV